jgi:hypothetical protein
MYVAQPHIKMTGKRREVTPTAAIIPIVIYYNTTITPMPANRLSITMLTACVCECVCVCVRGGARVCMCMHARVCNGHFLTTGP